MIGDDHLDRTETFRGVFLDIDKLGSMDRIAKVVYCRLFLFLVAEWAIKFITTYLL